LIVYGGCTQLLVSLVRIYQLEISMVSPELSTSKVEIIASTTVRLAMSRQDFEKIRRLFARNTCDSVLKIWKMKKYVVTTIDFALMNRV
jgi:hypothetical protein